MAKYLSFRVGHHWYGVAVDRVIEVLHLVALSEIPGAPPDILGLMTLRDIMMPVIDLRVRFGDSEAALRLDTPIVAVRTSNGALGLVADEMDDVRQITGEIAYYGEESPYITGVIQLPDHPLLLLDVDWLRAHAPEPE